MGLASGCSVHGSRLSGGFHLPSLVAVLCSAVAVSRGRPGCLRDTSGGLSLRNTSSLTGDLISSRCNDYEQSGKLPAIDCPEVPSLHHVEVRVVAGQEKEKRREEAGEAGEVLIGRGSGNSGANRQQCVTVLAQLHIWHKSRTLPGSSICTVACLLCHCLVAYLAQVTHLARKFHLHCCLFAPLLPDPLPIRTSPAPPSSSLLFFFSSFLVFRLVHQSKSQVSSQVRSKLPNQLGLSSALPLPRHTVHMELPGKVRDLCQICNKAIAEQTGNSADGTSRQGV